MYHNIQPIEVLIAEDEETDAFFVEQAFGQSKLNINVHWVKDGQEVVDFLNKSGDFEGAIRPHLVILDIHMPRKTGLEALEEIKGSDDLKDIPVIVVSGSLDRSDIDMAYKLHANAYMPKANGFENMSSFLSCIEDFWFVKACLPTAEVSEDAA